MKVDYWLIVVGCIWVSGISIWSAIERKSTLAEMETVHASSVENWRNIEFDNGVWAGTAATMVLCAKSKEDKQLWLSFIEEMKQKGLIRDQAMIDRLLKESEGAK